MLHTKEARFKNVNVYLNVIVNINTEPIINNTYNYVHRSKFIRTNDVRIGV